MSREIGSIAGIFISPAPPESQDPKGGFDMVSLQSAMLIQGNGIMSTDGRLDRYFGPDGVRGRGLYKPDKTRQLSIITWDAIERANNKSAVPFTWADTRRNIVVYGLTAEELNELGNKLFKLGAVEIQGTGLCEPCNRPSKLVGKEGFKEGFTGENKQSFGGIRAAVVTSGVISVGEPIYL